MATKATSKKAVKPADEAIASSGATDTIAEIPEKKVFVPKEIDPSQYVTVRNGFQGKLIYQSKRTGEKYVWEEFGDEQDIELSELKNARNSAKQFFINNWFMFDEPWIVQWLGMDRYYKYAVKVEDFDSLFEKSASEVEEIVGNLSEGQKRSISYRARQLIAEGEIDSNKMIATLEKCLNTTLIER